MEELLRELYLEEYGNGKIDFIPKQYMVNPLYPECDIDIDGELVEDESEYTNFHHCTYDDTYDDTYDSYRDIEETLLHDDLSHVIEDTLMYLNERERTVINMWFGLNENRSEYTIVEISKELSVTKERVWQILSSSIKKLKHPIRGRYLKTYLEENEYDDYTKGFRGLFMFTKETLYKRFMFIAEYVAEYMYENNKDYDKYKFKNFRIKSGTIKLSNEQIENFKVEFSKLLLKNTENSKTLEINTELHNNEIYVALRNIGIYKNYYIPDDMKITIELHRSIINVIINKNFGEYFLYPNGKTSRFLEQTKY